MLNNRRMSALHRTDRTEIIMLKITALAENISENELLSADFGLSLYIEFGGKKILLDTASTGKCLENAEKLGINLHSLDAIVLSHGHFDHTDGAVSLIENGITDTPVYISRYAFSERYWHRTDDGEFYFPTMAGISPAYLQRKHVPFRALCTDSYELGENIYILSNISRSCEFEAVCPDDFVKVGNDYVIDDYRDECVLVLDMGDGLAKSLFFTPSCVGEKTKAECEIISLLDEAKTEIKISTPYFIPDDDIQEALQRACDRSVRVKIFIPGIADKKLVNLVTKSYYQCQLERGIEIFEFEKGFIHSKNILIDDSSILVGTINLDYRSFFRNFECGVIVKNSQASRQLADDFSELEKSCKKIEPKDLPKTRLLIKILRFFAPIL